tara:strand:- start:202 stop:972 length:771 start_codon:yes stop_codon:yes gene_type:complete
MSGGSVLNAQGKLVGIQGQGETDAKMTEQRGVAVKTGTNQAVPISYYQQFDTGQVVVASTMQATSADDYLAQAKELISARDKFNSSGGDFWDWDSSSKPQQIINLTTKSLAIKPSSEAYIYRASANNLISDHQGAINDYSSAIRIDPLANNSAQKLLGFDRAIATSNSCLFLAGQLPRQTPACFWRNNCYAKLRPIIPAQRCLVHAGQLPCITCSFSHSKLLIPSVAIAPLDLATESRQRSDQTLIAAQGSLRRPC